MVNIAMLLACIPIIIIEACIFLSGGNLNTNNNGLFGLFLITYYVTAGIPFFVASIVYAIKGYKTIYKKNAIIALIINFIPLLIFIVLKIFMKI